MATWPVILEPQMAHTRMRPPPLAQMPSMWQPKLHQHNVYHSSHCDIAQDGWRKWAAEHPDMYSRRSEAVVPDWYTRKVTDIQDSDTKRRLFTWEKTQKPTEKKTYGIKIEFRHKNLTNMRKRNITTSSNGSSPLEYCMDSVKKYDYENYLSTLLLPTPARSSMFAVRAFNIEIAQIQDVASNYKIAEMRMHFWTDSLDLIYKEKPPQTPVALALTRAVKRHGLSKTWLSRLIESRLANVTKQAPFGNIEALEDYAEKSVSSVYYLTLQCLGIKDVHADHAASHIGKAQGIFTMLRAIPHNAERSYCCVPVQSLIEHKVSQNDIVRGKDDQKVKDLAYSIAGVAHQHLETARSFKDKVPKTAVIALISTVATEHYLKALQQADFNLFDKRLQQRNHRLAMQLWLNKIRNRY